MYHKEFASLLEESGVDVVYEKFLDTTTINPLISYLEISNTDEDTGYGDSMYMSYSTLIYQVKIFSFSVEELQTTFSKVDKIMKREYWTRTMCYETSEDEVLIKILKYKKLMCEQESFE